MLPSHNPDGTQKVTRVVPRQPGHALGGRDVLAVPVPEVHRPRQQPRLVHVHAGGEPADRRSTSTTAGGPQIVHDVHQMGARAARLFAPPYVDPWEPNVDPALHRRRRTTSARTSRRASPPQGTEGRRDRTRSTTPGRPSRAYPHTHGGVRILTECASARMASPIEVPFADLRAGDRLRPAGAVVELPRPLAGRDLAPARHRGLPGAAATCAIARARRARTASTGCARSYEVNRRAARRAEPVRVRGARASRRTRWPAAALLAVLRTGGVEVHRARASFEAGGRAFAAGLPRRPDGRSRSAPSRSRCSSGSTTPTSAPSPGGPPQRPYDVTAHTLPLLMGVDVVADRRPPFHADLEPVGEPRRRAGPRSRAAGGSSPWATGRRTSWPSAACCGAGSPVRWATAAFSDGGRDFPAGTLLVPRRPPRPRLEPAGRASWGSSARAVCAAAAGARPLRAPRVGLYQSWVASMDEGWTRFVFEHQAGVDYETLHDARRPRRRPARALRRDRAARPAGAGRSATATPPGAMPPEYVGRPRARRASRA